MPPPALVKMPLVGVTAEAIPGVDAVLDGISNGFVASSAPLTLAASCPLLLTSTSRPSLPDRRTIGNVLTLGSGFTVAVGAVPVVCICPVPLTAIRLPLAPPATRYLG